MNYEERVQHITNYEFQGMKLPAGMADGLAMYLTEGIVPGDFLRNILCHDIYTAAMYADHLNMPRLHIWISYIYNHIPLNTHGSKEIYENWIEQVQKARQN